MEKANIAVKYDVEFNEVCLADDFRKHLSELYDMNSDVIEWHNEDETCYELNYEVLVDCHSIAAATGKNDLALFITHILNLKPQDKSYIRIELY